MTVTIPFPWQLTDFLSCMGLGFAMGLLYELLCLPLRRRLIRKARPDKPFSAFRRRLNKTVAVMSDAVWAFSCFLFARGWAVSESRAAQLRGSSLLGLCLGCVLFYSGAAPLLNTVLRVIHFHLKRILFFIGFLFRFLLYPPRALTVRYCFFVFRRRKRIAHPAEEKICGADHFFSKK